MLDPGAQDLVLSPYFCFVLLLSLYCLCSRTDFFFPLMMTRWLPAPPSFHLVLLSKSMEKEKSFPLKVPELYLIDSYRTGFTSWASI